MAYGEPNYCPHKRETAAVKGLPAKRGGNAPPFAGLVLQSFPRAGRCQCGDDLPGTCPGVGNCPYAEAPAPEEEPDADRLYEDWRERRRIEREQGA